MTINAGEKLVEALSQRDYIIQPSVDAAATPVSDANLSTLNGVESAHNSKSLSVTAPSDALVTWLAYLARTPRV